MIDLDGLEGMHHVHLIETQARSLIKKTGDEEALVRFNESMMKMNNVQLAATAVPVGVALDLYLTRGQVTKALINQAKIQVIANASLEGINLASGETEDISSAFKNTLTKSLKGVDGADAILGVVFKNKSVANVLSSLVDLSINPETRELELKSLVKGKSATDITIDVVLNFVTDRAGDKIKNTKFSGPVKEAAKVAGLDINNFLKDFFKTKGLNTTGDLNIDELKNPTVESDATKVAHPPRFQDK